MLVRKGKPFPTSFPIFSTPISFWAALHPSNRMGGHRLLTFCDNFLFFHFLFVLKIPARIARNSSKISAVFSLHLQETLNINAHVRDQWVTLLKENNGKSLFNVNLWLRYIFLSMMLNALKVLKIKFIRKFPILLLGYLTENYIKYDELFLKNSYLDRKIFKTKKKFKFCISIFFFEQLFYKWTGKLNRQNYYWALQE